MNYRTIADLDQLIRDNIHLLPHDIDIVVGVPRSGMLPATMIALYLNTRLADLGTFLEGRTFQCGERRQYLKEIPGKPKVLIVDDSVFGGGALREAKALVEPVESQYNIIYCAPIVTEEGKNMVDYHFEVVPPPRVFEWNLFHHSFLSNACMDIDGVLCPDPTQDDDGELYLQFLRTTPPRFIPTAEVDTLISCRLEKYRAETEAWLLRYGVKYNHLVLLDMPDKPTRLAWGKHGEFKGNHYRQSSNSLFIESDHNQAQTIANTAQKPVICTSTNRLVLPNDLVSRSHGLILLLSRIPGIYKPLRSLYHRIRFKS